MHTTGTVFESWHDVDFYGSKARHVYFYGYIDQASVQDLRRKLYGGLNNTENTSNTRNKRNKSKARSNLPIVIHLHSQGGLQAYGIALANMISEMHVPVAIVVDGYACSAATPMLVAAPYRVMHQASFVLFHESSFSLSSSIKAGELAMHYDIIKKRVDEYKRFYKTFTNLPSKTIDDMMARDAFMDHVQCIKHKVVDRVINLDRKTAFQRWDICTKLPYHLAFAQKTSVKHLYSFTEDGRSGDKDNDDDSGTRKRAMKAFVNSIKPLQGAMTQLKPVIMHSLQVPSTRLFDVATQMVRVHQCRAPIIAVIDVDMHIINALPSIMAWKRYMYENTFLQVSLVYEHQDTPTSYYDDIKHNTELLRKHIQAILKQYTKMPQSMLTSLFDKRMLLSAQQCKDMGIVDEIIAVPRQQAMKGGCTCSQGLPLDYI